MVNDDIRDLMGRYATGSLTAAERERLFNAALEDQSIFDELAQEQEMKQLIDQPGARDRLVGALRPPPRKHAWIFGVAAIAALAIVILVFAMRSPIKPPPVEVAATKPAPPPVAQTTQPAATPVHTNMDTNTDTAVEPPKVPGNDPYQVASSTPPRAPQKAAAMGRLQAAAPKQEAEPTRPADEPVPSPVLTLIPSTGFHYSMEEKGHLYILPILDNYLTVKSDDGTVSYGPQKVAAGIRVDIPLPESVKSVAITFSDTPDPVNAAPAVHDEISGSFEGKTGLSVRINIKNDRK